MELPKYFHLKPNFMFWTEPKEDPQEPYDPGAVKQSMIA
jgi:hypothetical protein